MKGANETGHTAGISRMAAKCICEIKLVAALLKVTSEMLAGRHLRDSRIWVLCSSGHNWQLQTSLRPNFQTQYLIPVQSAALLRYRQTSAVPARTRCCCLRSCLHVNTPSGSDANGIACCGRGCSRRVITRCGSGHGRYLGSGSDCPVATAGIHGTAYICQEAITGNHGCSVAEAGADFHIDCTGWLPVPLAGTHRAVRHDGKNEDSGSGGTAANEQPESCPMQRASFRLWHRCNCVRNLSGIGRRPEGGQCPVHGQPTDHRSPDVCQFDPEERELAAHGEAPSPERGWWLKRFATWFQPYGILIAVTALLATLVTLSGLIFSR